MKAGDTIKVRVTAAVKPTTFYVAKDMMVMREDGTIVVIKAGTEITISEPAPPYKIETTTE